VADSAADGRLGVDAVYVGGDDCPAPAAFLGVLQKVPLNRDCIRLGERELRLFCFGVIINVASLPYACLRGTMILGVVASCRGVPLLLPRLLEPTGGML
jgi:hypothetical protein